MRILSILFVIATVFAGPLGAVTADEPVTSDLPSTKPIQDAIENLDNPEFQKRETATEMLSKQGLEAIPLLVEAAEKRSTEASIRAFGVLQRMFGKDDASINEAAELAFQKLRRSEKLDVAARAVRIQDNNAETRQKRAIPQFERLGGMIHFAERDPERQNPGRPQIDYVMLGRDWTGGNEGVQILTRIEELRHQGTPLYIIRGINISEETLLDLAAEMPFLDIRRRGPAKLGIRKRLQVRGAPVEIEEVDPGSAADRAGLKTGDKIVKIDGKDVSRVDGKDVDSFERLIEIIGEKEPGDRVPIVFFRDGELQNVEVVLSSWSKKEP